MTASSKSKQLAYVLDDDPAFRLLLTSALKRFGIACEAFPSSDEFYQAVSKRQPALCILDLNVESAQSSIELVKKLRNEISPMMPIWITSGTSNPSTIAAILEAGADDFLLKPLEREVLISKLKKQLSSPELDQAAESFSPPPSFDIKVVAGIDGEILEVDEFGFRIQCNSLISKGAPLFVSGETLREITGNDKPLLLTVTSTEANLRTGIYESYLEFDSTDATLASQVRSWLGKRRAA